MREFFPILDTRINGWPLVYYDNAATLQMPAPVLEAVENHYKHFNGNVHRSSHTLARESQQAMEEAREKVARFIGAEREEIIFTSGTTQSINMLAQMIGQQLCPGDEIIVSALEHHSNLLPWVELCKRTGIEVRIIPVTETGDLDLEAYGRLLSHHTRLVCVTWVSNAIGTVNPVEEITAMAHRAGSRVLVDGAQAMLHLPVDVGRVDCDFLAFSGHKLGALTGIGVLYGKKALLEELEPVYVGGGMVDFVRDLCPSYAPVPHRFEAGTPNYVGAISLGAAVDFLQRFGISRLSAHTQQVLEGIREIVSAQGGRILGSPKRHTGVLSVTFPGVHPYDLASVLDQYGVAVRAGQHCASYALAQLGVEQTLRISPAFYNSLEELAPFERALEAALKLLKG